MLVIGCGAGVTAGAVSIDPSARAADHRGNRAAGAAGRLDVFRLRTTSTSCGIRKTRVHLDDARHYLLTTDEKFDAITSDPLDPWVKGAAMLYTREFFEIVKSHLNPGGVVTLFVQLYESNTEAVKSEIATFMEAFPNGIVWGNTQEGRGYDLVLLAQMEPGPINVDEIQNACRAQNTRRVAQSLSEIGIYSAVDLFATYAGRGPELTGWMRDAMINRDRNLQPAIPRRARTESLSERSHLRRHDLARSLSGRPVHRIGCDDPGAARGYRPHAGSGDGAVTGSPDGPRDEDLTGGLTTAETAAVLAITVLVSAVVVSYLLDRLGIRIAAIPVLLASVVGGAVPILWQPRPHARGDVAALAVVVLGVLGALVWLAWPELLPVGGGSDQTHHLQLIDFIDRHGRLAHTAADALLVGNMVNYTPGSHLLASLAGAWAGTDGLHAVHAVVALTVALKAGFVFLIARRMLGGQLRAPFAVGAVLLLFTSYDYFIGSFARFSFFAQVVSELFAVVMWLGLVLWERRPSAVAAALFGIAGVGVFLTWPVWIGSAGARAIGVGLDARRLPARDSLALPGRGTSPDRARRRAPRGGPG